MQPEDPDDLVGIPIRSPRVPSQGNPTATAISATEVEGRNAAYEVIPLGNPMSVTEVPGEIQNRRDTEREKQESDLALKRLLQVDAERANSIIRRTGRSVLIALVAIVAGFCGFVLCTQLIQAVQILTTWPSWVQAIGWVALVACGLLVVWSIGRLLWFVIRLQRNRPITRKLLEEREHLRELGSQAHAAAREQLGKYMELYAIDDPKQCEFLKQCGVPESDLEMMKRKRVFLLDTGNLNDSKSWQENFEAGFLLPLDTAAKKIIKRYAVLTAAKTAICPYALLDMAVVIYMGTSMLGSLCRVYRLRAGPLDMVYLFALVVGQAFFALEVEEHMEEVASAISEAIPGSLHSVGISTLDLIPGLPKGVGKIAGKAGQGIANGFLLNRIGRYACKLLRPLSA